MPILDAVWETIAQLLEDAAAVDAASDEEADAAAEHEEDRREKANHEDEDGEQKSRQRPDELAAMMLPEEADGVLDILFHNIITSGNAGLVRQLRLRDFRHRERDIHLGKTQERRKLRLHGFVDSIGRFADRRLRAENQLERKAEAAVGTSAIGAAALDPRMHVAHAAHAVRSPLGDIAHSGRRDLDIACRPRDERELPARLLLLAAKTQRAGRKLEER